MFVGLVAGAIGGFIGWLLQESLINYGGKVMTGALPGQGAVSIGLTVEEVRTLMLCVGGFIGLCLGAVDGFVEGKRRKLLEGAVIGAVTGFLFGYIGLYMGNRAYDALGGESIEGNLSLFSFTRQVIARAFGWALMGLGLGVGSAIATRTPKRIWHGAIGGLLGGFGGASRMVGFTAIGALTGFAIGLVQELMKQAWVRVLAGRNEGKDFILSKQMNLLGRDERCDVPLYGDPRVGVQHAAIRADGNRHTLIDAGTPIGTIVNGQQVPPGGELLLRDGDMIQIGSHQILFREKATASKIARPAVDAPKPKATAPVGTAVVSGNVCPFCGAAKN